MHTLCLSLPAGPARLGGVGNKAILIASGLLEGRQKSYGISGPNCLFASWIIPQGKAHLEYGFRAKDSDGTNFLQGVEAHKYFYTVTRVPGTWGQ